MHLNLFAQPNGLDGKIMVDQDSTLKYQTVQKKEKSHNRVNLACGIGLSYGLAGISISYDFARHWGAGLTIGAVTAYSDLSLRYNFFIDQYPLVISPRIHFGTTNNFLYLRNINEFEFHPAIGLGTEIRTYVNRFLYVNNNLVIEYIIDKTLFPNTGICLGFTFRGESTDHHWLKDERIPSGGLAILNVIVGIFGTVFLPLLALNHIFDFGIPSLYD
jgi:hypothetical protein